MSGELIDLGLVEVSNGLQIGRAVSILYEKTEIELQTVRSSGDRKMIAIRIVVLHHLAGSLFEVRRRQNAKVGRQAKSHFPGLSLRGLRDQRKNRVAIGLNQVGQNNFRNPASRVLRENHANRFITPPITARGLQGGGNVLDDRWHAQLIRQLLPQPKAVRGGLRLRKQERDYVVCAERVYTQSGNNGAVDASGNRDDCSLALELQKDGFANHGRDTFALRGSIDFQDILS